MFEGGTEKGLFTFYWQEYQNHKKEVFHKERIVEQSPRENDLLYKFKREMEEKKLRQEKGNSSEISSKIKFPLAGLFSGGANKENKVFELPKTFDLSSKLDQAVKQSCTQFMMSPSCSPQQTRKKSEGLLNSKKINMEKQKHIAVPSIQTIQKLVLEEPMFQVNQLQLKIGQHKQNEIKFLRSNRIKKNKKAATQIYKGKLTQQETVIPVSNESQQTTPRILPTIRATYLPPKKARRPKDGQTLQKVIMDRCDGQPSSSVINVGVESTDQYRERWKHRKQQFLKLLSRNLSDEVVH